MTYSSNRAIDRLQIHTALATFAQGAGGVFVFVYMLRAGVAAPLVFCAIAAINTCRFAFRPLVLPLARRFGVKPLLILGTTIEAAVYPLLAPLHGAGAWLVLVIAVSSVGSVFYWTSYHAYYAALGDTETRGAQIGARQAIMGVVNVIAPALGGLALARLDALVAFGLVGAVELAALLPLFGAPVLRVVEEPRAGRGDYLRGAVLQSTDGWMDAGFFYVWQIGLFLTLGMHFAAYGGAMALAGLLGAVASLGVGRLLDAGHGRAPALAAYGLTGGAIALQAVSLGRPALAVIANAASAFAIALFAPVMMTRVYNMSKASPCPLRFQIASEGGWDIGGALGCMTCAALIAFGAGLPAAILTALLGATAAGVLLASGYGGADERTRTSTSCDART
jgi:DHA1 family inner membrane transport protein